MKEKILRKTLELSSKKAGDTVQEEDLLWELGLDSLEIIEVLMDVEREFNVSIPDERVDNFRTITPRQIADVAFELKGKNQD